MKKVIVALLVGFPVSGAAQSLSLPVLNTQFDLSGVVSSMHPCYVFDQRHDNLAGAYIVGLDFHTAAGDSIAQANIGMAWAVDGVQKGQGGPMLSIGFRADNLAARTQTVQWVRDHMTSLKLPAVEVGPFGSWVPKLGWLYGLFVSTKL